MADGPVSLDAWSQSANPEAKPKSHGWWDEIDGWSENSQRQWTNYIAKLLFVGTKAHEDSVFVLNPDGDVLVGPEDAPEGLILESSLQKAGPSTVGIQALYDHRLITMLNGREIYLMGESNETVDWHHIDQREGAVSRKPLIEALYVFPQFAEDLGHEIAVRMAANFPDPQQQLGERNLPKMLILEDEVGGKNQLVCQSHSTLADGTDCILQARFLERDGHFECAYYFNGAPIPEKSLSQPAVENVPAMNSELTPA